MKSYQSYQSGDGPLKREAPPLRAKASAPKWMTTLFFGTSAVVASVVILCLALDAPDSMLYSSESRAQREAESTRREAFLGKDLAHLLFPNKKKAIDDDDDDSDEDENGANNDFNATDSVEAPSSKKSNKKKTDGPKAGCEATIVILRHCEKGQIREHCAYVGYERAVFLASLFGHEEERWPSPSLIYALDPDGRRSKDKLNFREIETVGPLSSKLNVPVDYSYGASQSNELGSDLLNKVYSGELCGKIAVVSWKHSLIGHLARRLGCGPLDGCPVDYKGKVFDDVWQIKYEYGAMEHSTRKNLKLPHTPEWKVFGSVQQEGFDPLAFSKIMGDYPEGGKATGASWKSEADIIPERKSPSDTDDWVETADLPLLKKSRDPGL